MGGWEDGWEDQWMDEKLGVWMNNKYIPPLTVIFNDLLGCSRTRAVSFLSRCL